MTRSRRDDRLTLDQSQKLSKARVLGQGRALPIYLEDWELTKIVSVILSDVGQPELISDIPRLPASSDGDYYNLHLKWFSQKESGPDFIDLYLRCVEKIPDFETYFENLCELHKRR